MLVLGAGGWPGSSTGEMDLELQEVKKGLLESGLVLSCLTEVLGQQGFQLEK